MRQFIDELDSIDYDVWIEACNILKNAYDKKSTVWIGGNGGNSANAHHFATDWNKGIFLETGRALKTHTLWDNPALSSAFSNDLPFSEIFALQLRMLANPGDIAVFMSAGGKSKNVIEGAKSARDFGLTTIGLTGGYGLEISQLFDCHIHIPTFDIQIVEDIHALFGHTVYKYICAN